MKAFRIIFLDMDGVLNSMPWLKSQSRLWTNANAAEFLAKEAQRSWLPEDDIDPAAVEYLNAMLCERTRIVISSSWRYAHEWPKMQVLLDKKGFKGTVIGETPACTENKPEGFGGRAEEILAWLWNDEDCRFERDWLPRASEDIEIESFIVLDDIDMSEAFGSRMILTHLQIGLQDSHIEEAKKMLSKSWERERSRFV